MATTARTEPAVTFRIHDHRDAVEIEETTTVTIDGRQIGIFRLGPDREEAVMTVTVTGPDPHIYALCGQVTVRSAEGPVVTREVNGAGALSDVQDRDFDAVALNDFTLFYLRDITPNRAPASASVEPRRGCLPKTS